MQSGEGREDMEYVAREDAVSHEMASCTVYEYAMESGEMNIGVAEIRGRYPEAGYAVNQECCEMGYVLRGSGRLVTEEREVVLGEGDVVSLPRGEKYYWEGELTVVLPAAPAWHPAQHAIVE